MNSPDPDGRRGRRPARVIGDGRAPAARGQGKRRRRLAQATLRVAVTDALGRSLWARGLARWLARLAPRTAGGDVTVALVSDARMRTLNRRYRRDDTVTDVLSFAVSGSVGSERGSPHGGTVDASGALGDIVIATGRARRQARVLGHPYAAELRILALHGLLHLLGYDHARDGGQMARLEQRLRRRGGLPPGLVERHGLRLDRAGSRDTRGATGLVL